MKLNKIITNLVLGIVALTIFSCGPSKRDALKANDKVVAITNACSKQETKFFKTCKTYVKTDIEQQLATFLNSIKESKTKLNELDIHEKLTPIKTAGIALIDAYVKTENHYKDYAASYSIPDSLFTDEEAQKSKVTSDKIEEIIAPAFKAFADYQEVYAKEYGFKLSKNKF